jgi:hypothetical protein
VVFDGEVTTSTHRSAPRMVDQPGVRFGLASGAVVLVFLVAAALPLDLLETASLGLLAASVAGATLPHLVAGALGIETWAFFTGFFENRYGVLTLTSHDLALLAGFVAVTVVLAQLLRARATTASGGATRE